MKKPAARGQTAKHAGSKKHAGSSKHVPAHHKPAAKGAQHQPNTTVAKHPHHAKARQLSPGEAACCAVEAVAASARLAGHQITPEDVLELYGLLAPGQDEGVPIVTALIGALEWGIGGVVPEGFRLLRAPMREDGVVVGTTLPGGPHAVTLDRQGYWSWGEWHSGGTEYLADIEESWKVWWPSCL